MRGQDDLLARGEIIHNIASVGVLHNGFIGVVGPDYIVDGAEFTATQGIYLATTTYAVEFAVIGIIISYLSVAGEGRELDRISY